VKGFLYVFVILKKKKLFNGLIKVDPKLAENPCPNND
jgi:hypothetical protein